MTCDAVENELSLVVGTDSTWSLRAWMCLKLSNVSFNLKVINLSHPSYKQVILAFSPVGLVPVLLVKGKGIHDSLAIAEWANDDSDGALFPEPILDRAHARSLLAELHAGFFGLRGQCPFTLQQVEQTPKLSSQSAAELKRLTGIFSQASVPFMFDKASAVDAFYAILAYRLHAYGISLDGKAGEYQESLLNWPLLKDAIAQAREWKAF